LRPNGPSFVRLREADARRALGERPDGSPLFAAVRGREHDVAILLRQQKTRLRVEEADVAENPVDAGVLRGPGLAAIGGRERAALVAAVRHDPADPRRDELDLREHAFERLLV